MNVSTFLIIMADQEISPTNFSSYIQENIKTLAEGIKSSGVLPVGSNRNNFNACYPSFTSKMKPFSDQVLNRISIVLQREGFEQNIQNCDNEERIDLVVDGVNKILDRVRDNLNIMNGSKIVSLPNESPAPKENASVGSWNKNRSTPIVWKANQVENTRKPIHTQRVIDKPQLKFENKVDNTDSPFEPTLQSKPNALKPLAIYLERNFDGVEHYCHPYMHELNAFEIPQHQLEKIEPIQPISIDTCDLLFVDNEKSLAVMIDELRNARELAIDLEHHQYRSFQGITCMLQISTRVKDYVVDTIALRSKLHVLNEFFTDPKIVKVLHGADCDVIWLQKDLNLYLVNMFDTYVASTILKFPRLNLAYLLKHYCNADTDKRYQLFDWRTRPLPEAAMSYARSDTHYLLFIYDNLRNELIDKGEESGSDNLLRAVYSRSVELCKKRYEKTFDVNGHLALYKHSKQLFDGRQMCALKLLYQWRDGIARERDESTGFVLPNHMLMQIAEILPREMQGILACCNPIPPLVRQNLSHIHQLVAQARSQPINKMSDHEDAQSMTANKRQSLSTLKCPHDFSHQDDFRDNLATLLNGCDRIHVLNDRSKPTLSVFDCEETSNAVDIADAESGKQLTKFEGTRFMSPYERYKRTVEFELAQAEKRRITEKTETEQRTVIPTELEENVHIFSSRSTVVDKANVKQEDNAPNNVTPVNKTIPSSDKRNERTGSGTKRGHESLSDEMPARKCVKYDDVLSGTVPGSSRSTENDFCFLVKSEELENETEAAETPEGNRKKKNDKNDRKKKKKQPGNSNSTNSSTPAESSFKPFDYAKANYDKFVSAGQKNLKKLLNAKITFGSNKKNKNKKQKFQVQRKK